METIQLIQEEWENVKREEQEQMDILKRLQAQVEETIDECERGYMFRLYNYVKTENPSLRQIGRRILQWN